MNIKKYAPPVDKLLSYGDSDMFQNWDDYLKLGFTEDHIPDLIHMATDQDLYALDSLEGWAPIHAWRTLGQLKAQDAIEPLMSMFEDDSEWANHELPKVYEMIGPTAINALSNHLNKESCDLFSYNIAAQSLARIGNKFPETKNKCIKVITDKLNRFVKNDPLLNGFLIGYLIDLKALDSFQVIKKAFNTNCVDIVAVGDLEDVEIRLGIREQRSTPKPDYQAWAKSKFVSDAPNTWIKPKSTSKSPKVKVGRNAPCPCGSGKKYKKCCLE